MSDARNGKFIDKSGSRGYCTLPGCYYIRGVLTGQWVGDQLSAKAILDHQSFGVGDDGTRQPPPFHDDMMNIPNDQHSRPLPPNGAQQPTRSAKVFPPVSASSLPAKGDAPENDLPNLQIYQQAQRPVPAPLVVPPSEPPQRQPLAPPPVSVPSTIGASSVAPTLPISPVQIPMPTTPQPPQPVEPPRTQIESSPPAIQSNFSLQRTQSPRAIQSNFPLQTTQPLVNTKPFNQAPENFATSMKEELVPYSGRQPSALCPSLVLPTSESRFAVSHFDLARAGPDTVLQVVSLSGKALLSLRIREAARLEVSLAMQGDRPRCVIKIPEDDRPFLICGPSDSPYGSFSAAAYGVHEVSVQGGGLYKVEGNSKTLKFSVTTPKGEPVALARLNNADYPGGEHFEIRTLPGTDTVLVTAVVMAIAIFTSPE